MSSLPVPPAGVSVGVRSGPTFVVRPLSGCCMRRCTAFAITWSSALHAGIPTRCALRCMASAMGLFMCGRHAEPITCTVSSTVKVPAAAARAITFASSNIFVTRSTSRSRKKNQIDAVAGTTFGWSPPSVIT